MAETHAENAHEKIDHPTAAVSAPGSTSPKRGRSPVLQRKMAAKKIVSSAMTTTNRKCSRNEKNDCEPGRYFSTSALICWPKPPSTNERIIISSMPSV